MEDFYTTTLPNGMNVVVYGTTRGGPKLRVQCVYNFGSNAEASDAERGLAHVNEHMLFKGTMKNQILTLDELKKASSKLVERFGLDRQNSWEREELERHVLESEGDPQEQMSILTELGALHLSESDIDQIARYYGAGLNAFTSDDKTSYYFEMGKGALDPFLCILASEMRASRLDENHLRSEIEAVLNEMAMGNDNGMRMALSRAREQMYSSSESGHYDTIGSEVDLLELDATTLRDFYERHYKPWNATLYVVGDINDPREILTRVRQYFGSIAVNEFKKRVVSTKPSRASLATPPSPGRSKSYLYHLVPEPVALYGFRFGKSDTTESYWNPQAVALGLGGLESSRLKKALVQTKNPLATSVGCFVEQTRNAGELYVVVSPNLKDASLDEQLVKIEAEMQRAFDQNWTLDEVKTIKNQMTHGWMENRSSLTGFTNSWVDMVGCTGDHDGMFSPPQPKTANLAKFCKEHLQLSVSHAVVLTPTSECKDYDRRWKERASLRKAATQYIHDSKRRDDVKFPLESPHTANRLPKLHSFKPSDFEYLREDSQLACTDISATVICPRFLQQRRTIMIKNANLLSHTMESLIMGLTVETRQKDPAFQQLLHQAESRGVQIDIGSIGASMSSFTRGNEQIPDLFDSLVQPIDYDPHRHESNFEEAKYATIVALRSQKESGMATAAHMLSQRFLVDSNSQWTFDDAIRTVQETSGADAFALHSKAWQASERLEVSTMPSSLGTTTYEHSPSVSATPRPSVSLKMDTKDLAEHVDRQTAQTVIGLGRAGLYTTTHQDAIACLPLLQVIAFHSLGSRIYKIREKTGLFYSASGVFGLGSGPKTCGMDRILLRVKPNKTNDAILELQAFQREMATHPNITEFELHSAQSIVSDQWISRVHEHALANTLLSLYNNHPDWNDRMHKFPSFVIQQIESVTVDQINEFSKRTFSQPFHYVCTVGPISN